MRVGIDIGGTFTDFALQSGETILVEKVLSTPADPSRAVMSGLERLAARQQRDLRDFLSGLDAIVHATTIADNTLIEMKGARTGLITTQGFRDELELRRGYKEDIWDVRLPPPPAIVPRRRRLGVPERIRFNGEIYQSLDEGAARRAIQRLAAQGVESVAICTLFSFVNPVHEQRLAELVAEELPDVEISLSHEVLPRAPEFERTSTTVVNAYVGPRVSGYLDRLEEKLASAGYQRDLLVMQASGGVMTRDYLRASAVRVLASGPAGGVVGGARTGVAKGAPDLLCVDMGGTSYDVSVVRGGGAPAEPGWNWHHRYVVAAPMIQVETLGAGGGSLCQVERGELQVGPESAGAEPGPVCYGRGGTRPTVTDASLVLGLLSEDSEFAGGRFSLSRKGVDEAFQEHVAGPLGCGVEEAAFDCWRVVNANMSQAVRRTTAGKGIDPRGLAMLAYGGNGPVFAAIQAQELGIDRVLVPRTSPGFSALGALSAQPAIDEERSYLSPVLSADVAQLRAHWGALCDRARRYLHAAGFADDALHAHYALNLRYPGQNDALAVTAAEGRGLDDLGFLRPELRGEIADAFHRRHEAEYGYSREGEEPEVTGVRLQASASTPHPPVGGGFDAERRPAVPSTRRRANLGTGYRETAIFRGAELSAGHFVAGPAIIEERYTTIVVYADWEARVDDALDYELVRTHRGVSPLPGESPP